MSAVLHNKTSKCPWNVMRGRGGQASAVPAGEGSAKLSQYHYQDTERMVARRPLLPELHFPNTGILVYLYILDILVSFQHSKRFVGCPIKTKVNEVCTSFQLKPVFHQRKH